MTPYQKGKEEAREQAIEMQEVMATESLSYRELAVIQERLETLAKRYGLKSEFKENGIL